MMTNNIVQGEAKAVSEKIKVLEIQVVSLYEDLRMYQSEVDETQDKIDNNEYELKQLKERLNEILFFSQCAEASPTDYINYMISDPNFLHRDLKGQYFICDRWTVCNGNVLVDSEKQFEDVPTVKGCAASYGGVLPKKRQRIEIDFENAARRELKSEKMVVIQVGKAWVQPKLIQLAIGIVGKPLRVEGGKPNEAISMECEHGRALVLPVRMTEEAEE